jgi:cysteine-rich repeat protein
MSDKRSGNTNAAESPPWPWARRHTGLLPWALLAAVACGGGRHHPGEIGGNIPLDLDHSGLDAGSEFPGDTGELTDAGADAGGDHHDEFISIPSDSGSSVDPSPGSCGDAVIDPGEECDPGLAPSESCEQRGFAAGLLACSVDCHFSTESCSGVEDCYDGHDDDGDGLADCADADCASACADACVLPLVVSENASVSGTTQGHPALLAASCSEAAPSGSEVAYQVTVSEDSKLDVLLTSDQVLNASVRSSCAQVASEMACGSQTRLTVDAVAGQTYFILVDGASAADAGAYLLELHVRQEVCGDGVRDADEECDDGNTRSSDGCDADCLLELSVRESNNRLFRANSFDFSPWFAQISPAGDVDFYSVSLTAPSSTLVVDTLDLGDGACASNTEDTRVDILDASGNALASDDDDGEGKCSLAVATGLPAGSYFVRVQAGAAAASATFPYRLEMWVGVCGDGDPTLGEGCDDGNRASGDGCDADCQVEAGP